MGYGRKNSKYNPEVFRLSDWKDGVPVDGEKDVGRTGLAVKTFSSGQDIVNFRCLLDNHLEILSRKLSLECKSVRGWRYPFSVWYFVMSALGNSYRRLPIMPLVEDTGSPAFSRLLPSFARLWVAGGRGQSIPGLDCLLLLGGEEVRWSKNQFVLFLPIFSYSFKFLLVASCIIYRDYSCT